MTAILDTGPIAAYVNRADANHPWAKELFDDLTTGSHGALVSTDYVLDEGLTLLRKRPGRIDVARHFGSLFLPGGTSSKTLFEFRQTPEDALVRAYDLYLEQFGRGLSFTDCTLAVLTQSSGGVLATFDQGFNGVVPTLGLRP